MRKVSAEKGKLNAIICLKSEGCPHAPMGNLKIVKLFAGPDGKRGDLSGMTIQRYVRGILRMARKQYVVRRWQDRSREEWMAFRSLSFNGRQEFGKRLDCWACGGLKAKFPDIGIFPPPGLDDLKLNGTPIPPVFWELASLEPVR